MEKFATWLEAENRACEISWQVADDMNAHVINSGLCEWRSEDGRIVVLWGPTDERSGTPSVWIDYSVWRPEDDDAPDFQIHGDNPRWYPSTVSGCDNGSDLIEMITWLRNGNAGTDRKYHSLDVGGHWWKVEDK